MTPHKWEMQNGRWRSVVVMAPPAIVSRSKHKPTTTIAIPTAETQALSPKTTIVIIAHNRLDMTSQCITAILKSVRDVNFVFVDNGSTDGTPEWIAANLPGATLVRNPKNMGVPYARNQGIRLTKTDYVVLMDNDVIVQNGWLDELTRPLLKGADIVGIEGWQLDNNFHACKKCTNPMERFDYLSGACCMFKRKVFEQVGLYDEGFSPAYYEDVDLVIRAKKAGMKTAWIQSKLMAHKEHSTLLHGQKDFKYQDALTKSYERFANKMRGGIKVTEEKLPPLTAEKPLRIPTLETRQETWSERNPRILYLGMQYDYGVRNQGLSFEHCNFHPALKEWKRTSAFEHFDFVDIAQTHGIAKMSEMLYERVQSFCPDAIFAVFFDPAHDPQKQIFDKIRATTKTKTISWFCDSHYRYSSHDRNWAPHVDWCVTTSQDAVAWYKRDGLGGKVIKSQWAASPLYKKSDLPADIDVSFVGQPHGNRREMIERIRKAGINIHAYGTGWAQRLSFEQMIGIFSKSKINLNMSLSADLRHRQIKGRIFEVPACGGLLLTDAAENLHEYYKFGDEIIVYGNIDDAITKMKYFLSHDDERSKIADAGYRRTIAEHTFANRFEHIFGTAGLI
jgi:spore maturation protein CgeB/glycosyltransferase involved in cell wall biosynthesis